MNQKCLFLCVTVTLIASLIASVDVFSAVPNRSRTKNVVRDLDFPNDEKQILVRKIQLKKNIAFLSSIQIQYSNGRRYFILDDYAERNFICKAFGFVGAFNNRGPLMTAPIVFMGSSNQALRLTEEDDLLTPYRNKSLRVSLIDSLPCKTRSS